MKLELRQKLAHQPFAEKVRQVAQLIRLAKTFPRRPCTTLMQPSRKRTRTEERRKGAAAQAVREQEALKHGLEAKSKEFVEKGAEVDAKA